jgi:anthranilate synthase component 1
MTDTQPFGGSGQGEIIPVIDSMPADLLTPLAVYLKLAKTERNSFLLESVEGGVNLARYSFIGVDPRIIIRGDESSVEVRQAESSERYDCGVYDFLRDHFRNKTFLASDDLPSFAGGAIGYMGFDCVQWFEPSLKTEDETAAEFMIFDSVVAFDHARQLILIISLVFPGSSSNEDAQRRNAVIRKTLENSELSLPAETGGSSNREIVSNWTQPDFENAVSSIK